MTVELLAKKCKYFYEMDEIFGAQHNIVPPVIMEPGRTEFNLQGGTKRPASTSLETALHSTDQPNAASGEVSGASGTTAGTTFPGSGKDTSQAIVRSPPPVVRMLNRPREDRERDSAKRHKADMDLRGWELALKQEHFALYKEELRLKEKKMDQQFELLTKQIALRHKRLESELAKRSTE